MKHLALKSLARCGAATLLLGVLTFAIPAQPDPATPPPAGDQVEGTNPGGGPGGPGGPGMPGMHPGMMRGDRMGGDRMPGMGIGIKMLTAPDTVEKLGLSTDQVAKLKALDTDNEKKTIDADAAVKKARVDLRQALEADEIDRDSVMSKLDETAKLEVTLRKLQVSQLLDVRDILTPEQRTKAKEMIKEMRAKHMGGAPGAPGREGKQGPRPNHGKKGPGAKGQKGAPAGGEDLDKMIDDAPATPPAAPPTEK
jgi:Spy/CpxP family protein refolding chaperone